MDGYSVFRDDLGMRRPERKEIYETDKDTFHRVKRVTQGVSESVHILANEPSLALFRLQEHVVKSVPELMEHKREMTSVNNRVLGASQDLDYALNSVQKMRNLKSISNIQDEMQRAIHLLQHVKVHPGKAPQTPAPAETPSAAATPAFETPSAMPPSTTASVQSPEFTILPPPRPVEYGGVQQHLIPVQDDLVQLVALPPVDTRTHRAGSIVSISESADATGEKKKKKKKKFDTDDLTPKQFG